MFSIPSRLGLVASFAFAAIVAAPRPAAAWAPTKLDCDNLVPWFQSNNYGWWWGALGNCKQFPGGPQTFEQIFQCAWKQVEPQYRLDCVEKDLRGAPNTAMGVNIVAAFNGKPTCDGLFALYSRADYGTWTQNILAAKVGAPRGLTNPIDVFNFAFNRLQKSDQQQCLRDLFQSPQGAGALTTATIQEVVDFNTPGTCNPLIDRYKDKKYNLWWQALGTQKTGRGGPSTRDEIINKAFATLPAGDQEQCLKDHLTKVAVTDLGVFEVRAFNGIEFAVRDNQADEPFKDSEDCDWPADGSMPWDYTVGTAPYFLLAGGSAYIPANYNTPPGQHLGTDEGRLAPDLRRIAQLADPIGCALPLAAHTFAEAEAAPNVLDKERLRTLATAYSDLAVTGTRAFEKFSELKPNDADFCAAIETRTQPTGCLAFAPIPVADVRAGCVIALRRAYRVANFLRNGQALRAEGPWFEGSGNDTLLASAELIRKKTERLVLGWIAVSGEDDAPHRPVNVPSSNYPQYNIQVYVPAPNQNLGVEMPRFPAPVPVTARYTIAQSIAPPPSRPLAYDWKTNPYFLDPDPVPSIARGSEVLLFIHGMDSRAEEATDITKHLFMRMANSENPIKKNLVVITVDLPSSGYTESLDYDRISKLAAIGVPAGISDFTMTGLTPMLDFLEDFVVTFVETLPGQLDVPNSMRAVMGGSLGGNLTFRLGRRPNTPWVRNVVTWSPASIWTSLGEGTAVYQHAGPRAAWEDANDRNASDPNDLFGKRLGRRQRFFDAGWDHPMKWPFLPQSQPEVWTSVGYKCRQQAIYGSRLDRQETYNPLFLSWRWRLAAEQLLYSHQTFEPATGQRRFMRNDKRMFLSCGREDDVNGNEICDATRITGDVMSLTPGMARYLYWTGHSLDAERPRYFARKMDEFLGLQ
ncbi:MAG: hypothetical protein IPQ07_37005 [Myxococcales bacterium]|nr:hypothetical protein [Myxococcales bacterium]